MIQSRRLIGRSIFTIFLLTLLAVRGVSAQDALPRIYDTSSLFSLTVGGREVPVVDYDGQYDYAHFSKPQGTVVITVHLKSGSDIESYTISPQNRKISASSQGRRVSFEITKSEYLIVKVKGKKALVIAADDPENNRPSSSGKGIFNVLTDYQADNSGLSLATEGIQKAVDDASAWKGRRRGLVYVPAGIYLLGNLELKSNIEFYMESGAVFLFSGKASDYTTNWHKDSQKRNITWWIYTKPGAKNIKMFGRGIVDGNGRYATREHNFASNLLVPMAVDGFEVDGLLFRESSSWAITPIRSRNVTFRNLKVFNRFDMGENDGIDIMESQNVLVERSIGVGLDDPFSAKTWDQQTDISRAWPGSPMKQENVLFRNLLSWTYCYGFKIGQGVRQDQENVRFENSTVYDAAVGIGIHHKYGSGNVRNAAFRNIDIERLSYQNEDNRTWAVFLIQNADGEGGGNISGLNLSNIRIFDKGTSPAKLKGLNDGKKISNVRFEKILMPGSVKAGNLEEMNMTTRDFNENIRVQ